MKYVSIGNFVGQISGNQRFIIFLNHEKTCNLIKEQLGIKHWHELHYPAQRLNDNCIFPEFSTIQKLYLFVKFLNYRLKYSDYFIDLKKLL